MKSGPVLSSSFLESGDNFIKISIQSVQRKSGTFHIYAKMLKVINMCFKFQMFSFLPSKYLWSLPSQNVHHITSGILFHNFLASFCSQLLLQPSIRSLGDLWHAPFNLLQIQKCQIWFVILQWMINITNHLCVPVDQFSFQHFILLVIV